MDLFFGGGPRFSPSDLEPLEGDPERLRSAGRMLHDAAGALDFAQRASEQLQKLTDGVSWRGNAFQAFKAGIEHQPLPKHLVNARNVLGRTGDELTRLATVLEDIQADAARLRTRADLLGVDGEVPEPQQAEVQAIQREYEDLKERRDRAMDQAAALIDELTDKTVFARPAPSLWGRVSGGFKAAFNFSKEFAVGVVEGTVQIGKGIVMLGYMCTPQGMTRTIRWVSENRHMIGAAITYAMEDPFGMAKQVGKVVVDYDTLRQNPGRWLGKLAPELVIAVATAGVGGVASKSSSIAHKTMKATGPWARKAEDAYQYTKDIEQARKGIGKFAEAEHLTNAAAFKKGIYDTFVNKPYRNVTTLWKYRRKARMEYILHGRKTMPFYGKINKKISTVTAAAAQRAASDQLREDLVRVVEDHAAQPGQVR